jgi:tetratricopeptide (TPR) repeat protein
MTNKKMSTQQTLEQASALLSSGKHQAAEVLLREFLVHKPEHENGLALFGHSLLRQKKIEQAIVVFQDQIKFHPQSAQAQVELASAFVLAGHINRAEKAYQSALELNPKFSEAWFLLGNLLMQKADVLHAKDCYVKSERTDPFRQVFVDVEHALQNKQYRQAEQLCRQVLQRHPNHPRALHTMATLAEQVNAYEEAVKILNRGLEYAPYHINLWQKLVKNLAHLGLLEQSVAAARKLLSLDPQQWRYHMTLAAELANIGKFDESLQLYDKALTFVPNNADVHLLRGHVLKTLGKRDECERAYRKSLELEEINGTAYWALADLKSYQFEEDDLTRMSAMLIDPNVAADQASQAGFALAKSLEDKGHFDQAFEYYIKANKLRPQVHFQPQEYQQSCDDIKQNFSVSALSKQAELKKGQATPIFIVGLTRSGSTLLEQILASHSSIEGTMELFSLPRTVRRAGQLSKQKGNIYPDRIDKFTSQELAALGQSYLDETAVFRTNKAYFIDKMPPNFHNVGLIHMILPNAIVIDARRHPLSTGLSNFKQHFAGGYDFSYNLENIGHYYNTYLSMMDHWDRVLPGKVLRVQYENLVQDTENQIRQLLTHCGLDFEQQCLNFHQNKRAVRTASSEQVRQPINQKGMQQWRNFEKYLGPLRQALGSETLERFSQWG